MKKYKFITIRQVDNEVFNKKPVYRVFKNRSGDQLAILSWEPRWKEYVFSSREHCVFNDGCLKDVLDFMDMIKSGKV